MRFGRKKDQAENTEAASAAPEVEQEDQQVEQADQPEQVEQPAQLAPPTGPHDISEVDIDVEEYVDLGSVLIPPVDGAEVRMHVDEESGEVMAVMVMNEQGAVEVRAFAASRNTGADMWDDVRRELAAETTRRGGTAGDVDGPFGPELHTQLPMTAEDGEALVQPSRVIGVTGNRWFLRATLLGAQAVDRDAAGPWEALIRGIVVRRDETPMPPGEALPLTLPPQAIRQE